MGEARVVLFWWHPPDLRHGGRLFSRCVVLAERALHLIPFLSLGRQFLGFEEHSIMAVQYHLKLWCEGTRRDGWLHM